MADFNLGFLLNLSCIIICLLCLLKNEATFSAMVAKGQSKVRGVSDQIGCPSLRC